MAYDVANRLTAITPASPAAGVTFTLDALGRHRTRVLSTGGTDTYAYAGDGGTVVEISNSATGTTRSLLDLDGSRLAVKAGAGAATFTLFDALGSLIGLVDGGRTITAAARYDGWGATVATAGPTVGPWRFRGSLDLSPTGDPLYAMGARLYAPSLGAFTQADTYAGSAANPASMHRFLYAEANPATLIDPTGHRACTDAGGGCEPAPYVTPGRPPAVTSRGTGSGTSGAGTAACPACHASPAWTVATPAPLVIDPEAIRPAISASLAQTYTSCVGGDPSLAEQACDDYRSLLAWDSQNEAAFCAASEGVCQLRRDLAMAEVGLTFETAGIAVLLVVTVLDPVPGDEAVVGAGGVGLRQGLVDRAQGLRDRIGALRARGSSIPGGSLWANEDKVGRTLSRHVGMSDADLLARFGRQPGLVANSTFYDLDVADAVVDGALRQQARPIEAWLVGTQDRKEFTTGVPGVFIGRQAVRTSSHLGQPLAATIVDVEGIRVTLIRNPAVPGSYQILRAFPEPLP